MRIRISEVTGVTLADDCYRTGVNTQISTSFDSVHIESFYLRIGKMNVTGMLRQPFGRFQVLAVVQNKGRKVVLWYRHACFRTSSGELKAMKSAHVLLSVLLLTALGLAQQQQPSASQGQTSQGQASSSAAVQSITGCVVQSDNGYSLKTESDTYPIETQKDLSHYVNKEVKVTGVLEHHNASAPSSTTGNATTITDLRLRVIVTVIGDCSQSQK
jgi:hypothetical protein